MWQIKCAVSGGVTGTRTAMFKNADGDMWAGTENEAITLARKMEEKRNGNVHATAHFAYTAIEIL